VTSVNEIVLTVLEVYEKPFSNKIVILLISEKIIYMLVYLTFFVPFFFGGI